MSDYYAEVAGYTVRVVRDGGQDEITVTADSGNLIVSTALLAQAEASAEQAERERDELQVKLDAQIRHYAEDWQEHEDQLVAAGIAAYDDHEYKGVGRMIAELIAERDALRDEVAMLRRVYPYAPPPGYVPQP